MNEAGFWSRHVRPALHRPPRSVAWKVQDAFRTGVPDVDYCLGGVSGKLELKYRRTAPKRATTRIEPGVTVEQLRHLTAWAAAGGLAHVLYGLERRWWLLEPDRAVTKLLVSELDEHALDRGVLSDLRVTLPLTLSGL